MSFRSIDRLSSLPEDITAHVLSLMPTKCAVRTSILSRRWRYSWTLVWNLDFEDIAYSSLYIWEPVLVSDSFSKFVDRVMDLCRSSQVKLFRLHIPTRSVSKSCLLIWTDKAVRLNACEIDIRAYTFEFPLSLLSCKALTTLRLNHYDGFTFQKHPCPVNLPCLKILDIKVSFCSFVSVSTLISGCPILESLSFQILHRDEVEDYIFNVPTLKHLNLTLPAIIHSVNKVVLHVPKLEFLFVGGGLWSNFVMENVSSLVEASVPLYPSHMDDKWVKLLKGISGVRSLSVRAYGRDQIISPLPIFLNLKHLDLQNHWHPILVLQFLESFPELKHLRYEFSKESRWIKQRLVPSCMLTSLTTINISKFAAKKADVLFLRYMLGKARVLKTVTISCDDLCIQGFWAAHLLSFPRASPQCEVRFL